MAHLLFRYTCASTRFCKQRHHALRFQRVVLAQLHTRLREMQSGILPTCHKQRTHHVTCLVTVFYLYSTQTAMPRDLRGHSVPAFARTLKQSGTSRRASCETRQFMYKTIRSTRGQPQTRLQDLQGRRRDDNLEPYHLPILRIAKLHHAEPRTISHARKCVLDITLVPWGTCLPASQNQRCAPAAPTAWLHTCRDTHSPTLHARHLIKHVLNVLGKFAEAFDHLLKHRPLQPQQAGIVGEPSATPHQEFQLIRHNKTLHKHS